MMYILTEYNPRGMLVLAGKPLRDQQVERRHTFLRVKPAVTVTVKMNILQDPLTDIQLAQRKSGLYINRYISCFIFIREISSNFKHYFHAIQCPMYRVCLALYSTVNPMLFLLQNSRAVSSKRSRSSRRKATGKSVR